jgi:hypothetical protein
MKNICLMPRYESGIVADPPVISQSFVSGLRSLGPPMTNGSGLSWFGRFRAGVENGGGLSGLIG